MTRLVISLPGDISTSEPRLETAKRWITDAAADLWSDAEVRFQAGDREVGAVIVDDTTLATPVLTEHLETAAGLATLVIRTLLTNRGAVDNPELAVVHGPAANPAVINLVRGLPEQLVTQLGMAFPTVVPLGDTDAGTDSVEVRLRLNGVRWPPFADTSEEAFSQLQAWIHPVLHLLVSERGVRLTCSNLAVDHPELVSSAVQTTTWEGITGVFFDLVADGIGVKRTRRVLEAIMSLRGVTPAAESFGQVVWQGAGRTLKPPRRRP